MIRVNLLGEAKAKRRRRVRAPLIAPGSGVMLGLLIGVMVVVLGVQYWRYGQLQAEGKSLDQQVAEKTRERPIWVRFRRNMRPSPNARNCSRVASISLNS